jgi:Magnesium chelatase, subunit ChlI C-terminal
VAARIAAARDIQAARYAALGLPYVRTNAEAPAAVLETIAQVDAAGTKLLREASESMRLSARAYHRVLRVARARGRFAARGVARRHCEPTGRANARPMTGSTKQSSLGYTVVMPALVAGIHVLLSLC